MSFLALFFPALVAIQVTMICLWLVSIRIRNASIVDVFWGLGFVLASWIYYLQGPEGLPVRQRLVLALATIWGLRLSLHLLRRNWRKGEDYRYRAFRRHFGPRRYWWVSLFQTFLLQGTLLWLISAPLLGAQISLRSDGLTLVDGLAALVWSIGFVFEAGGDWQLARFKANPANEGELLTTGFWRYTRHPNYFGDAMVWWGFGLFSLSAGSYLPVLGSLLMSVLLLRVSGVTMLEKGLRSSKPGYEAYTRRTNAFFPWFPKQPEGGS
jgi:steroid 5-alpha reductase family enzyme